MSTQRWDDVPKLQGGEGVVKGDLAKKQDFFMAFLGIRTLSTLGTRLQCFTKSTFERLFNIKTCDQSDEETCFGKQKEEDLERIPSKSDPRYF